MSQYGFSTFDKKDAENGLTSPQTAGPLTPVNPTEWAFESNFSNGSYQDCPGFFQIYNTSGCVIGIQALTSASPVSISNSVASGGWITNLLLFKGVSYPLTCTLNTVQVTSNVCTITTSAQHFIVGTQIQFPSGLNSAFLNGQLVTILNNTGTTVTFAFTHADAGPTTESSGITNFPYLQKADGPATLSNSSGATNALTLPNNVTPGSMILVFLAHGDINTYCTIASLADGTNSYSVSNIQGTGGGADPGSFANFAWAVNSASSGSLTVTATSGTYHNPSGGGRYVVMELPALPTLVSIAVTPTSPSIAIGNTQQFTATGTYSDNSTQNLTSTATWASATTSVATITAGGLATGVSAGTSNITATVDSVVSPADTLTVTSPPIVQGKGFIPLPFTQRTTASVALFPCILIASATGAQQFTSDAAVVGALQLLYAQLNVQYMILRRQDVVNQRAILVAAVATGVSLVGQLKTIVDTMTASDDAGTQLAHMQNVVAGGLTQISNVKFDEQ